MKGITPVIAVILLLLITISIVGFSMLFFQRTAQTATQAGDAELEHFTKSQGIPRLEGSSGNNVYLRSVGGTPLENPTFFVANQKVDATGPASLAPGQVGTYILDENQLNSLPSTAEIKVTTNGFSDSIIATLREILAKIFTSPATVTGLVTGEDDGILFKSSTGVDLAAISDSGLMGIGTTSPSSLLTLSGDDGTNGLVSFVGTGNAIINSKQSFLFNIDSDSSQTDRVFTIYKDRTGQTDGTHLFTVQEDGNVGIGTTAPDVKLEIQTSFASAVGNALHLTNEGLTANRGFGTGILFTGVPTLQDGDFQTGRIYSTFDGNDYTTVRLTLQSIDSGGSYLDTLSVKNGNVGIGTTNPLEPLHVVGNSNAGLTIERTTATTGRYSIYAASTGGSLFIDESGVANRMVIQKTTGNVGIGTTTPQDALHVSGGSGTSMTVASTTNGNNALLKIMTSRSATASLNYGWQLNATDDGATPSMALRISRISEGAVYDKVTIDTSGNVGIGTISPGEKLHIQGTGSTILLKADENEQTTSSLIKFREMGDVGFNLRHDGGGTCNSFTGCLLIEDHLGVNLLTIYRTGNVGIGTTTPGTKLHIAGGDSAITNQGSGLILRATDGPNCFRVTVNNAGTVSAASVACP